VVAVLIVLAAFSTGCTDGGSPRDEEPPVAKPSATPEPGVEATSGDGAEASPETPAEPELVSVPDVIGLYPDEAERVLRSAGLEMQAVAIHGPIDPDAGNAEIGQVYRQTPAAGTMVPKGTVIEVRSWWESS
jgi:hypothetical protein